MNKESEAMSVTIYSTTTCTFCGALRKWLDENDIRYDYKLTDEDPAVMQEYLGISDGVIGVPFTVIKDDAGKVFKILGFDKPKLRTALELV
jgi:glutaredoxin 3